LPSQGSLFVAPEDFVKRDLATGGSGKVLRHDALVGIGSLLVMRGWSLMMGCTVLIFDIS
jgi:hypothetical protein